MTREEALETWLPVVEMAIVDANILEAKEALEMAIEALQQEPCEDCISRQAVNDLQKYRYNCGDTAITCVSLNSINELPPVTPQPKPNIKALGEDIRICQKSITDKKVLIGFNMAVALCNKHLAESEVQDADSD